jgi:hypothetical protein
MRIDAKSEIAGVAAIKVRDYLREVQGHRFGADNVVYGLKISARKARAVLNELLARKYIERAEALKFEKDDCYTCTQDGAQFAAAMATKPVSRSTADRHIAELMERIRAVNANPEYLLWVSRLIVFGSFLTDRERINDVDVSVVLTRKEQGSDGWVKAVLRRAGQAEAAGRRFSTFTQRLNWSEMEVMLFLRKRSRVLQFALPEVVERLGCPTRVYEFELVNERSCSGSPHSVGPVPATAAGDPESSTKSA